MTKEEMSRIYEEIRKPLIRSLSRGYECDMDVAEDAIQDAMVYILSHKISPDKRLWHDRTKKQIIAMISQCSEHRLANRIRDTKRLYGFLSDSDIDWTDSVEEETK